MLYTIAAVLVLCLDQAVKFWTVKNIVPLAAGGSTVGLIPGVIHMTNVQNHGAAFSILANQRWLLVAVSLLFIIGIIVLVSMDIIHTRFGRWTAVLVMAGALGNCIDRILLGYVVDMFEFELFNFAVFNVADIFITVCGILFCIHVIIYREPEEERNAVPRPVREKPVKEKKSRRAPEPEEDYEDYDEAAEEQAPRRPAKLFKGRGKNKSAAPEDDPFARIPHRGEHRSLDELRPQDPEDPFAEWDDVDDFDEPEPPKAAPASRTQAKPSAPARRRTAVTVAEDDDWDDDWDDDLPPAKPAAPAKRSAAKPAAPAKRSAAKPAAPAKRPVAKPAAPAKPAAAAPEQEDTDFDEYSLDDILSEFRDL